MSKFVPQESGGDEARVQKMMIGGWEGPIVEPQPHSGQFQIQKDASSEEIDGELQKSYPLTVFVPLVKVDASKREVYGVMAEEAPDKSGEVFDYASSKPYVQQWSQDYDRSTDGKSLDNIRSQHGNTAAGKIVRIEFDDENKRIPIVAKIVDENEWKKIVEGVYTGFSIGGAYVKKRLTA